MTYELDPMILIVVRFKGVILLFKITYQIFYAIAYVFILNHIEI